MESAYPNLAVKIKIVLKDIHVNMKHAHWANHQGKFHANIIGIANQTNQIKFVLTKNALTYNAKIPKIANKIKFVRKTNAKRINLFID